MTDILEFKPKLVTSTPEVEEPAMNKADEARRLLEEAITELGDNIDDVVIIVTSESSSYLGVTPIKNDRLYYVLHSVANQLLD